MKKVKLLKHKKHNSIVNDYDKIKQRHLEKIADNLLKNDDKNQKLKEKNINLGFLDLF
jgi:AAA+ superfamily predicted ATPase